MMAMMRVVVRIWMLKRMRVGEGKARQTVENRRVIDGSLVGESPGN